MFALISDVHGNLQALRAVLKDIQKRRIKDIFFLGDAVGYGPEPNECVSLIQDTCEICLAGNHDWAALGLTDISFFNPVAAAALVWTKKVLRAECKEIMSAWPLVKKLRKPSACLVHSSPEAPASWPYLLSAEDVSHAVSFFKERICFVGHSHRPFIAETGPAREVLFKESIKSFARGKRYVVNIGSVGQPRDGDPRACYATLGERSVRLVRVEYPVEETQRKMEEAGLPEHLISRLSHGR